MKFNLGDNIVEIKVKSSHRDKANKMDTMCFLNELSMVFHEASVSYTYKNCPGLARSAEEQSIQLYELLEGMGLYKN